jgi:uncharacterized lipoprotein
MRKMIFVLAMAAVCAAMAGCAVTIPTGSYIPQNYVRYDNPSSVDIAPFAYLPLVEGKVKLANQIRNTAAGSIHFSSDVAEFVRRVNALEFEKTGIQLNDKSKIRVSGDIIEFYIDDLGYSANIHYTIKYFIKESSSEKILYSHTFSPSSMKMGKFGTPAEGVQVFNNIIAKGYEMFITDPEARSMLDVPPLQDKKQSVQKK